MAQRARKFMKANWFSLGLLAALAAGWAWPRLGSAVNPANRTEFWAIVAIFFFSGLILPSREALHGLLKWRVHLAIEGWLFVLWPAAVWLALWPLRDRMPPGLVAGFYLLAVLPTTISSCVVFTQLAGGSVAVALFNAAAANMAGIVLTPALLFWLMGDLMPDGGEGIDSVGIMLKLGRQVVAPFAAGQAVHLLSGGRTAAWRKPVTTVNSLLILLIVWLAFCQTFAEPGRLGEGGLADPWILWPLAALLPLHLAMAAAVAGAARLLRFERRDRIAMLFTASQKTLSLGLPMASVTLGGRPELIGLAILPVVVYHPIQLLAAGVLKDWIRRREGAARGS